MKQRTARTVALAPAALVVAAPFTVAGPNEEPQDQHEQARQLCETADPLTYLTFAAAHIGVTPDFVPPVPWGADFTAAIVDAYATLHIPLAPTDVVAIQAAAAKFGPEAREPVAMLLQAWATATALASLAIKELSHAEVAFMLDNPTDPRTLELGDKVNLPLQVAAAQHLLETEQAVRPLLEQAVANGAFPDTPTVADPRGYIYIGSTGNDYDTKTRYFLLEPSGDDQFHGRVAGATPLAENIVPGVFTPDPLSPAAFGLDLSGNDQYTATHPTVRPGDSHGGSHYGVAIMVDAQGNDWYVGPRLSMGAAFEGVGIFVDEEGNDDHNGGDTLGQSSADSIAIAIDRAGNDRSTVWGRGQGYAQNGPQSFAAFCDLDGNDSHGNTQGDQVLGMAIFPDSTAWFTDLGNDLDSYVLHSAYEGSPAADSTYWTYGDFGGIGHGQDI